MNTKSRKAIFIFDLDNTLIKTDEANNLAYADAIQEILGVSPKVKKNRRYTRNDLILEYPNLGKKLLDLIIEKKENRFQLYIDKTILNMNLVKLLRSLYLNGCETILLTKCHRKRAIQLCSHFGIYQYFKHHYFFEDCNGYKYSLLKKKGYDLYSIVLFENEIHSSKEASVYGINNDNIIKVGF